MMKNYILTTTALTCLVASSALAAPQENAEEVAQLKHKIERLERVLDSVVKAQESQPELSLSPGIRVATPDGKYSFGIDGFIQADAGWIDSDNDLPDSTTIKRARLGVKGTIAHDWKYRILTDFGDDDFKLIDANLNYHGIKNTKLTAGQFKEPFSLEQLTAAKYWTFAEKASMSALTPKRSLGFGVQYNYGDGLVAAGLFGENVNKNRTDDEGYGVTARGTYVPIDNSGALVHVGLSGTYRKTDDQTNSVRFKNAGQNTLTGTFVDTGNIADVDSVISVNPEVAVIYDSFSAQAEYINTNVSRNNVSDVNFSGYYGEASYFLTGESRNYNKKKGVFGRIKPNAAFDLDTGGLGAWQVAYRYSHIDLNDGDIAGGKMDSHTLGLNWHPNDYTRISTNLIHNRTDNNAKIADENATILMLRTQFEF